MTGLTVRAAELADLEAMLALYDHLHPPNPRPTNPEATWRATLGHPGLTVFVGVVPSGGLVASCTLVVIPHLMRSGVPYALIEDVVTHSDHRQRGYGGVVLRTAIDAAWRAGCYKVMLMTGSKDPAIHRFYAGAGFQQNKTGYQIRRSLS